MNGQVLAHEAAPGAGPSVLFAHAFPFDRRMWNRQMAALREVGARGVAADLRGFGGSADMPRITRIDDHADDLARLLDHLEIDRTLLVGVSMGGYVALSFARRHAGRLQGLLLADTKATPDTAEARGMRDANIQKAKAHGAIAIFEGMLPKAFSPSTGDEVKNELRSIAASQTADGVMAALQAMRDREDSTSQLARIAVPTLVVVGEDDLITPPSDAQAMARSIPNATLQSIARAGHLSNVEQPEQFTKMLLSML